MSYLTENVKMRIDSWLGLADCCKGLHKFELSNKMLKKALALAWNIKDSNFELQIYELIGMNYYY